MILYHFFEIDFNNELIQLIRTEISHVDLWELVLKMFNRISSGELGWLFDIDLWELDPIRQREAHINMMDQPTNTQIYALTLASKDIFIRFIHADESSRSAVQTFVRKPSQARL